MNVFTCATAVLMLLLGMQSCNTPVPIPKYAGIYQIDVATSKLGQYEDVDSVRNLQLVIKDDSTFEFSKDVPFVFSRNGTWRLELTEPIELPPYYKCYFYILGDPRDEVLRPKDEGIDECYINSPVPKRGYKQVELISFKRIK